MPCGARKGDSILPQGFIVIQKQVSIFAPVQIPELDNRPFEPGLLDSPHRRGPNAGERHHPIGAGHQKSCDEEGVCEEGRLQHGAQPPIQNVERAARDLNGVSHCLKAQLVDLPRLLAFAADRYWVQ